MKSEVYEINEQGFIVEYLSLDENEITESESSGLLIITKNWKDQRLFQPKWDFQNSVWVEGLTEQKVSEKESIIQEQQFKMSDEDLNAIALMELTELIMGGE